MPKAVAKKKPVEVVKPVAPPPPPPSPEPTPVVEAVKLNLPVVYDKLTIEEYSTASEKGPLDIAWIVEAMGWETESEYLARMLAENPGSKPEQWMADPKKKDIFGDGVLNQATGLIQPVHCKNVAGEKVICWNNANNRPYDGDWGEAISEMVLAGQWAGPFTVSGETVNGETIRISRYGRVLSGQHQMTGAKLASEKLAAARANGTDHPNAPRYPTWRSHGDVFIETIIIKGMSEDARILMTVDYVKPRSVADMFYTSNIYKNASPSDRKDYCKVLSNAVDMLWTRTGTLGYKTHPEVAAFLERHKRLLKCTEHIFDENGHSKGTGRRITKLRLSPGQCAAIMFLQGSAGPKTDGDFYRNETPPSEKNLDWSLYEKAEEFWTLLAGSRDFQIVRDALHRLADSTTLSEENRKENQIEGLGGRGPEKLAILAKAWERWLEWNGKGALFDADDLLPNGALCLSYNGLDDQGNPLPPGPDGRPQLKLLDIADFYGIDCPQTSGGRLSRASEPEPAAPTREEIERLTEQARAARAQKNGGK